MVKTYVRENVPLSRFGVLVAQLESIVASAAQQPPEPLLCFDLLSDLISAIDEEPKQRTTGEIKGDRHREAQSTNTSVDIK
ncbi:HEAT repeat-containing protein 5B [Cucumis melo var. makuwa]|uniref:HEAT repeat-containing protein 5B n=1 Tax=Cucumis melo var. makuwa TaxID=1194695 RepID=A0A5D3BP95_CUCMM|nr:HEAT repeat-containing protein 5B [Cucumis melo var. makuwa]